MKWMDARGTNDGRTDERMNGRRTLLRGVDWLFRGNQRAGTGASGPAQHRARLRVGYTGGAGGRPGEEIHPIVYKICTRRAHSLLTY